MKNRVKVKVRWVFWQLCWLITIGLCDLSFWQGAWALMVWPYYLGHVYMTKAEPAKAAPAKK